MRKVFLILFCSIYFQGFSQTTLPTNVDFYEMALCDMINVYDTAYKIVYKFLFEKDITYTLYIEKFSTWQKFKEFL